MALSSFLSDKNLARFRTKPCERLVAKGQCTFGERCQYSHEPMARRNPKKVKYSTQMCPNPASCKRGDQCPLAHTKEEKLFHPDHYKTKMCESGAHCQQYYCPYAHSKDERRQPVTPSAPYEVGAVASVTPEVSETAVTAPRGWWFVGDQKDLLVSTEEVLSAFCGLGHQITGGAVRQARILFPEGRGHRDCAARLLSTSRGDSTIANRVIKDIRRWMISSRCPAFLIRRTVATTVLALPADFRCLDHLVRSRGRVPLQQQWGMLETLAEWLSSITMDLSTIHIGFGAGHLCLGPSSIFLNSSGDVYVGDFLGKVQFLRYAMSGSSTQDDDWAMWYPAEVQERLARGNALNPGSNDHQAAEELIDELAIDSWQLGVTTFFMLTQEHPFGPATDAGRVCRNIMSHRVENYALLEDFPLWADFIGRLLHQDPKARLRVTEARNHPLFWSPREVSAFADHLPKTSKYHAWLAHLPCRASTVDGPCPPPKPPAQLLSKLCGEALRGKTPEDLAQLCPTPQAPQVGSASDAVAVASAEAFRAGAIAGAAGVYAAMSAPPGLWPPSPHLGAPDFSQFTQEVHPFDPCPWSAEPWPFAVELENPFSSEQPWPQETQGTGPDVSFYAQGFADFCEPPGLEETPCDRDWAPAPGNWTSTTCEENEKTMEREIRFKEILGSLIHMLDTCDEVPMNLDAGYQVNMEASVHEEWKAYLSYQTASDSRLNGCLAANALECADPAQSEAQNGLVQFLTDFEVVPELLPKSSAFAVFREVQRTADVDVQREWNPVPLFRLSKMAEQALQDTMAPVLNKLALIERARDVCQAEEIPLPGVVVVRKCTVAQVEGEIKQLTEKYATGADFISSQAFGWSHCLVESQDIKALYVRVVRHKGSQLSLIDLPGVTHNADQMRNIHEVTAGLVEKYIEPEENVILCVIPAMSDFGNAEVVKLARKYDPEGLRTLGVVTKCDDAANAEVSDIVEKVLMSRATDVQLQLGFHCVVNRSQKNIDENMSSEDLRAKERRVFTGSDRLKRIPEKNWGTHRLMEKVAKIQEARVDECLPKIKDAVRQKLTDLKKALGQLPDQPTTDDEQSELFNEILANILGDLTRRIRAEFVSEEDADKEFTIAPRVSLMIKAFLEDLQSKNPKWLEKDMIDKAYGMVNDFGQGHTQVSDGTTSPGNELSALVAEAQKDPVKLPAYETCFSLHAYTPIMIKAFGENAAKAIKMFMVDQLADELGKTWRRELRSKLPELFPKDDTMVRRQEDLKKKIEALSDFKAREADA
ncbi:Dynamin-related protein 4C [Durusdinium trenchii]|uniref:Dynamin-related protein 4C n=1 Tax=Durusdinium trenchii TaxID=1381693 RepID=A0ABP0RCQ9_9DINO